MLHQNIKKKWDKGDFITSHRRLPQVCHSLCHPWIPYESYMEAQLIRAVEGKLGILMVKFPAETSEDNRLHVHPASDRIITVLEGTGEFICYKNKEIQCFAIGIGNRVYMPRGVLHTFKSGKNGMLVQSIHNPFVSFSHPNCLRYPKKDVEF